MANTCVTRYVIYTRKDVEGLNTIRQRIINGHPFNYDGHWVDLYEDEEVGPIEKAAHGYYFIFVTDTSNVPCNELVDDFVKIFDDMYYIYLTEDYVDLYMTNDVDDFFISEAWCFDFNLDKRIVDKRPELDFINKHVDDYPDEEEGREFLQRILHTEEKDPNTLISMLESWREWMQKLFPDMIVDMYAQHIDYDYDSPATVNIW